MRRLFALLPLLPSLLSPLAARAQDESITVTANDMTGPWKIGWPVWSQRVGMEIKFGPIADEFCRVEGAKGDLHIMCFPRQNMIGILGNVSLDGDTLHIAWGTMMARVSIDARQQSPGSFVGETRFKLSGIIVARTEPFTISKIVLSQIAPDADGKSALVDKTLADIRDGASAPSLSTWPVIWSAMRAEELRDLGTVESVVHLGRLPTWAKQ